MADDDGGLRATLIREAVALLENGAADVSLRRLARAAGVSAMAPYRHFADKGALLRAVAGYGFELLREALETADRSAPDRRALVAQGLAYIAFAGDHPALFRLMFRDHRAPQSEGELGRSAYEVLARRAQALVPDHPLEATLGCWAIVHGLATLALDGRLPSDADQARGVLELFVAGLGPPSA